MLIENEYFNLFLKNDDVVIHAIKKGYPLKSFDLISREHPRLKINSFTILRKALIDIKEDYIIGTWLPLINVNVSTDKMTVELIVNATVEELNDNKQQIIDEATEKLDKMGIVYGRHNLQNELFVPGVPIIAATGQEPIKGDDSVATYIERPDRRPVIREDGSADHYEMNFVFPVDEDAWLGEKTLPTEGKEGADVFGNIIPPVKGKDAILRYDKKSVIEIEEEGKVVIRALHGGALEFQDGFVSVGKHLTIGKDVGLETGSITFDGSVTVHGTVQAGYSIVATGDISIEGNEGVTNAKMIQSSEGDIYIKGGVFGGGETIVEAQGNIFIKHANNCKLYGKEIHVGLYLFGSEIVAENVYVDKNRGRIIGGTVDALYRIECGIVGNDHERTTTLRVKGVDKNEVYKEVQEMAKDLKKHQSVVERLEEHASKVGKVVGNLTAAQKEAYEKTVETISSTNEEILRLDGEIQRRLSKMQNAKPAEIEIVKNAFPGTVIQIGKSSSTLHQKTNGIFKVEDGVLNV